MPVVIGRNGISENLQWKRSNGLIEAVIPKTVTKSGEKKWRRLATSASQGEQNPGNDALGSGLHHDMDDCFPTADAKRERRLPIAVRHKKNNFLGGAQDERNHDQRQRKTTGVR